MKVVFHINESARWDAALGNMKNLLLYARENEQEVEIEIVVNGPPVAQLKPAGARALGIAEQLEALAADVRFCACRNALRSNHVTPEALYPFVQVVPAGVAQLALRQSQGFAYIKP